jgi:uncharacterized membrane protein
MILDSWPHTLNILVHVLAGTAAIGIGAFQLMTAKGGTRHRLAGQWFVRAVWVVVSTAAAGLLLFRFGAFLAVLTLLVAYWNYSGMRAARNRANGPGLQDGVVSALALIAVAVFLYFLAGIRFPWAPSVIYGSLGALVLVTFYDLARFTFPRPWFESLWLGEHVAKMIGAHGALVSAFAGTVLSSWQPYSQILPSVVWTALQIGFVIQVARRSQSAAVPRTVRRFA